jgi:hypothetical protein
MAERQQRRLESETYQCGCQAEAELYRANPYPYQVGEFQHQYEEMQMLYPQEEMPPMEHEREKQDKYSHKPHNAR